MTTDTDFVSFITKENKKCANGQCNSSNNHWLDRIFNQQLEALNDIYKYLQDAYVNDIEFKYTYCS